MLKYLNCQVTFAEVPDEISLCINITNCPIHCPECHSKDLWGDVGQELTKSVLEDLLTSNRGVSCICFMGGNSEPAEVNNLSKWIHSNHPDIKTAWYSGRDEWPTFIPDFDYIKIGPYIEKYGPLNSKTTNQKMVKIIKTEDNWYMEDITYKFWKDATNSD